MKYTILLFFSLLSTIIFCNNPSYAVANIPATLKENADAVIRNSNHDFKVVSTKVAIEKVKSAITIFNEDSAYDYLVVHYNKFKKVEKIKAKIFDQNGKEVRKIEKDEITDQLAYDGFSIYSDARIKYLDLSYGVYPYTVEVEYEVKHEGLRGYPVWQPQSYRTGVEQNTFRISLPAEMDFRYQGQQLDVEPIIYEEDDRKAYRWILKQQVPIIKESYCPEDYQVLPILITVPNNFYIDGYAGNMETWTSFGQFIYELNKGRGQLSPSMQQQVKTLTADAKTDKEKVAKLYQYLRDNMRYVSVQLGIGGWQTFDAKYVEDNKYGDCKALTYFMKAMLTAIDIPSYPALVTAGKQWLKVKEDFTTPYFNHVILKVLLDEPIWLECTSNMSPVGYLGSFTEDRPVLLITEKGGILDRTPVTTANTQIGNITIDLIPTGQAIINNQTTFTGTAHESFRRKAIFSSKEEQEKWLYNNQSLPSFTINDLTFTASDSLASAACNYIVEVPRYASKAGKRLFVPLNKVNSLGMALPKEVNRKHPVAISSGIHERDQITFKLPEGYTIESLPKPTSIDTEYGRYTSTFKEEGEQLIYERALDIIAQEIPATAYQNLRDFLKDIAKADNAKMVLVKE